MIDKTIKQRKQRMEARDKERGIVSARVRVPKARVGALRAIAEGWRQEAEEERQLREANTPAPG